MTLAEATREAAPGRPAATSAARAPKIVFYLPALHMGGAERHTLELRDRLAALGYPTEILVHQAVVSEGMREVADADYVRILGLHGMSRLGEWPKVVAALRRAKPDVVIAINEALAVRTVLLRALGLIRARAVCIFHSTNLLPSDELRLPLFRTAARFLDALVFVSVNQARYWAGRGLGARRPVVLVNGVDLERFHDQGAERGAAKQRLGLAPDDYVIGVLASFREEKNHAQAVRALAALRQGGVGAKLLLVGDGEMRPGIEQLVETLGLAQHVVFAGEHSDVRPVIAAFDVGLICSTEVETFSLAALEILATGAPMVMSDIGGASEIVEDGVNGFLFPRADDAALLARLTTLADPAERRAFQGRARPSVNRYSVGAMVEGYAGLIQDLVRAG